MPSVDCGIFWVPEKPFWMHWQFLKDRCWRPNTPVDANITIHQATMIMNHCLDAKAMVVKPR
jgi:hypothetical protein